MQIDGMINVLSACASVIRKKAYLGILLLTSVAALIFAPLNAPLTAQLPDKTNIGEMTWVEVRTAIEHGYTTVIVPSGGLEQNGPHMPIDKHDHIVRWAADRIARELKNTLVTPVVSFVPEGAYAPPTGHMRFPGTMGVSDEVFAGTLEGIARSLKSAGFTTIAFVADHGQSQAPQEAVARRLSLEWHSQGVSVIHTSAYYNDEPQQQWLKEQGETPATIGTHAGIMDTAELLAIRPDLVDLNRVPRNLFFSEATGVNGHPSKASAERGRALLQMKVDAAIRQIATSRTASPVAGAVEGRSSSRGQHLGSNP